MNKRSFSILVVFISIWALSPAKMTETLRINSSVQTVETVIEECSNAPIGENVTCKISKAYCSYKPKVKGQPTFCNDAPYPSNDFTLLIWGKDWSKYNGKCLIVTGYNHLYKGKPEIEATSEKDVKLCSKK